MNNINNNIIFTDKIRKSKSGKIFIYPSFKEKKEQIIKNITNKNDNNEKINNNQNN